MLLTAGAAAAAATAALPWSQKFQPRLRVFAGTPSEQSRPPRPGAGMPPPSASMRSLKTFDKSMSIRRHWPGLADGDISALFEGADNVSFAEGDVILAEGSVCSHFLLLLEGSASVFKAVPRPPPASIPEDGTPDGTQDGTQDGNEKVRLFTLLPGDVAGETALFEDTPLNYSLVSDTPTRFARIPIPYFRTLIKNNDALAAAIFRSLSNELRRLRTALGSAISDTAAVSSIVPSESAPLSSMCVFDSKPYEQGPFNEAIAKMQESHPLDVRFVDVKLSPSTAALAAGSQVVCIFVNDVANADVLNRLANLGVRCLALRCAGFNNVDLKAARALGIDVVRVPAYSPYAVAEHCVAVALALNRKIVQAQSRVKQGNFSLNNLEGFDFHGKTVGVVGTGKIGQCFMKIMLGFGCKILCYDAYPNKEVATWQNVRYVDSIDELYAGSRLISLHCPLLPTTKHMINKDSIAKMQKGVMIINTSRGALIETRDLIGGLKSGHIGSAGLDVYEEESAYFFEDFSDKLMTDDVLARLLTFNNVIITSHQAFLTEEALNNIADTTLLNVGQFLSGKSGAELTNYVSG